MNIPRQIRFVLVILAACVASSTWTVANDRSDLDRTLAERMARLIIANPLKAEGTSTDQQFCDVLRKMSDHYAEHWKSPLPIKIDFKALQHLRSSTKDLNAFMGLAIAMKDVPLTETLRDWCDRAELTFTIAYRAVEIAMKQKQTNKSSSK